MRCVPQRRGHLFLRHGVLAERKRYKKHTDASSAAYLMCVTRVALPEKPGKVSFMCIVGRAVDTEEREREREKEREREREREKGE